MENKKGSQIDGPKLNTVSVTLRKIASFFDEPGEAYRLLTKFYKQGYVLTPERRIPLREFFELQQSLWRKRQQFATPHSLKILQRYFSNEKTHKETFFGGLKENYDLDSIEDRRDFDGQYEARYGKFSK